MQSTWEVLPYIRLLPYTDIVTMNCNASKIHQYMSVLQATFPSVSAPRPSTTANSPWLTRYGCILVLSLLHKIKNIASFTENQNYFSPQKFEQFFVHGLHKPNKKKYTYGTFCVYLSIRWPFSVGQKTNLTFSSSAVLHLRPKTWHKLLLHWLMICSFWFPMNSWLGKSLLPMWGSNSH